jgi:hypothetical protein
MDITGSTVGVISYCIEQAHGLQEANTFFDLLKEPRALAEDDPVFQLWKRLDLSIKAKAGLPVPTGKTRRQVILDMYERRAFTIVAFNKWINGEKVVSLRWNRGGSAKQPFPLVDGYTHFVQEPST